VGGAPGFARRGGVLMLFLQVGGVYPRFVGMQDKVLLMSSSSRGAAVLRLWFLSDSRLPWKLSLRVTCGRGAAVLLLWYLTLPYLIAVVPYPTVVP